jgi:MinD-like ATPase involved in chromosome partitioning or flagellar assembly
MSPVKTEQFRQQFAQAVNRVYLVVNGVRATHQFKIADRFVRMTKRYLTLDMKVLGALPYEDRMDEAIVARTPFVVKFPDSGYAKGLAHIAKSLRL